MDNTEEGWTTVASKARKTKKDVSLPIAAPINRKTNQYTCELQRKNIGGTNKQSKLKNYAKIEDNLENEIDLPKITHELKTQIKQARQNKGWTQKEFAVACNINENIIRDYELGKHVPDPTHLSKMSRALGIGLSIKKK